MSSYVVIQLWNCWILYITAKLGKIFKKCLWPPPQLPPEIGKFPSTNILWDRLCLISITTRDGTPMDASSILEEDIMEICMKKGHTHPLGVLHYLATESVVLFSTAEDLKCASCGLVDIMELWNDAIMVMTLAPMETHMATFTTVWHSKPTMGDGELHTPSQQSPPSRGTLHCLQAELGDLNDHKLQQLMEDLTQEIAQCKLTVPPATPSKWMGTPIGQLRAQGGWPGGHLSRRGKVGSTEATHSSCRATSWRKGSLWTTPTTTKSCTSRIRHGAINYHPNIRSAHRHP